MKTKCTHCRAEYDVDSERIGEVDTCAQCEKPFVIRNLGNSQRMKIKCPRCEKEFGAAPDQIGLTATCTRCNTPFVIGDGKALPLPPPPQTRDSSFGDFLEFRKMITPVIIQILFWIGVIGCVGWGLIMIVDGVKDAGGSSDVIGGVLIGIGVMLIGPVLVRLQCEFLTVIFSINGTLTDIRNSLKNNRNF